MIAPSASKLRMATGSSPNSSNRTPAPRAVLKERGWDWPLTKKIIEFQRGRISVESEPGKGSVFTVVLPVMTGEGKAA